MRVTAAWALPALLTSATARFVMYADQWHPTRPTNAEDRAGIDHVVLAFAAANNTAGYTPYVPISTIRSEYPNAKIMIAVGGWGDDIGFTTVSQTDGTIQKFANDVNTMLTNTGADGVDIDWEYPGGNGADYKQVSNSDKAYQIEAFPKLLAATRGAIGSDKLLSIAVPGKKGDMIGFTSETGPKIWPFVNYVNVMSYDLMNRRDTITQHHTSVTGSEEAIKNYLDIGAPPSKINLGFAYYAKYFTTAGDCSASPLGCPIVPAEDPVTGKDTLTSGAWTFEKQHMAPVDASSLTISNDGTCGPEKGTKCASGCCSQYLMFLWRHGPPSTSFDVMIVCPGRFASARLLCPPERPSPAMQSLFPSPISRSHDLSIPAPPPAAPRCELLFCCHAAVKLLSSRPTLTRPMHPQPAS
ncbi:hypothetical protein OPT61_g8424 [Boeremia exigua]|uniref:Uncharacterized protein n=1 Tax=Boeremia exigua TaxID=749465 RepID=A0ACC2HYV7_9PLEO|nr:hypothetical protein OPT61_g8424 [Boeremia exigua]